MSINEFILELCSALPQSEGEGGSLSSRSSADDIVPVDGVRGSLLLKSPMKETKQTLKVCLVTSYQYKILPNPLPTPKIHFKNI